MLETPQPESLPLNSLNFGKANIVDFWATELAVVKTKITPSGKLGWIADNNGNLWFHVLKGVALNLICWYAIMAIGAPEKKVFRMAVREAIRDYQSFLLANLTLQRKETLVISPSICDDLHKFNFGHIEPYLTNPSLPDNASSKGSILDMTACQHSNYIHLITNGKLNFHLAAMIEKEQITQNLAKASYKALRLAEFLLWNYQLDSLFALSYTKDVMNQIGLAYSKVPLKEKTKLHLGQLDTEIKYLCAVMLQYTAKIIGYESNIKFIKAKQATADSKDQIIQRKRAEMCALKAECKAQEIGLYAYDRARDQDMAAKEPTAAGNSTNLQAKDEYENNEKEKMEALMVGPSWAVSIWLITGLKDIDKSRFRFRVANAAINTWNMLVPMRRQIPFVKSL